MALDERSEANAEAVSAIRYAEAELHNWDSKVDSAKESLKALKAEQKKASNKLRAIIRGESEDNLFNKDSE